MQDELAEFDVTEAEFDAMLAAGQSVEVTGPPDASRRLHFELIRGELRNYWWRLVAASGEILATSATTYRSAEDVRRAVSTLVAGMQRAPVVTVDDEPDLPDSDHRTIDSAAASPMTSE